jgi:hypothetical protein
MRISTSAMSTAAAACGTDDPVTWFRASAASPSTSAQTDTASEVNTVRSVGSEVTRDSPSRSR